MFWLKPVVHDFNPPLVTIEGPLSRFPVNGTHVCKENTIAERNVPVLSFVYHLLNLDMLIANIFIALILIV